MSSISLFMKNFLMIICIAINISLANSIVIETSLLADTTQPVEFSVKTKEKVAGEVSYQFDWGNNQLSEWTNFNSSSLYYTTYHYTDTGIYYPRVRYKEKNGNVSNWSLPCTVKVTSKLLKHIYQTSSGIYSPVAIRNNEEIYCATENGTLYCFLRNGTIKWQRTLKPALYSAPAIGKNSIYITSTSGTLYSIDFEGNEKWSYQLNVPIYTSIAITADENLVLGCDDGNLYCLSSQGKFLWKFPTEEEIAGSPIVDENDVIYCASNGVYAVDNRGRKKWAFYPPDENSEEYFFASPSLGPDGTIYIGGTSGIIYALTRRGRLKWHMPTPEEDPIRAAIAVDRNNNLFFGDEGGIVYIKRNDSEIATFYETDYYIFSTPAIDSCGNIYLVSDDGYFYAVRSDGKLLYKWQIAEDSKDLMYSPSPMIADDGTVYVGSWEGNLYAFSGLAPAMKNCWSLVRNNTSNNGSCSFPKVKTK
jgi:outer membrane protein assembly factor BamB